MRCNKQRADMSKKHTQTCPVAEFLNIFGDAWTLLIMREAFYGATRFGEFLQNTGIAKNILSERLAMLVDEDILERFDIGERGTRYEYRLSARGRSLVPVFVAINQWGNEQVFGKDRDAITLLEKSSGKKLLKLLPRDRDGKVLGFGDITAKAGPSANTAAKKRVQAALST